MQTASVTLPRLNAQGESLAIVHTIFAAELAQHFEVVAVVLTPTRARDEETGAEVEGLDSIFRVTADWAYKGGRLARRLENMAAKYAEPCGVLSVTIQHADGSTVYASPMAADPVQYDDAPAAPLASRRDREGWRALREDHAARFDRLTADAA